MKKVLIIAPHPDDETLGCGGTLLKHKKQGDKTHWLIVTSMSEKGGWDTMAIKKRNAEIAQVCKRYEFDRLFQLGFGSTELDTIPVKLIVQEIRRVLVKVKPEVIYVPFRNDIHTDHKVTFNAAMSALKTFRNPYVNRILAYETLSESELQIGRGGFSPNVFSDVTPFMRKKMDILSIYESELMPPPGPRSKISIESLARLRGSRIGVEFCEAFELLLEANRCR